MHRPAKLIDPRLPAPEDCVIRYLLERDAREFPDRCFVRFVDGSEWTFGQAYEAARRVAAGLQELGVKQGDHVMTWLPIGADAIRCWLGITYLGAVHVPVNLAYKGRMLEHVIELSDAAVAIVHGDLVDRLDGAELHKIRDVVVIDGAAGDPARLCWHSSDVLENNDSPEPLAETLMPWASGDIIFTSGTTGPSKGVMRSYAQMWHSKGTLDIPEPDDRALVTLPMFHIGGIGPLYAALRFGSSVAISGSFRTDTFWDTIRNTKSTSCIVLGSMAQFLVNQPPSPDDKNHTLRTAIMVPWTEDSRIFAERFDVKLWTLFNMTELSVPIVADDMPTKAGTAGKCREGFEIRLVDENDCEVPVGEIGELICRTDMPWALNSGYYKNPEATAKAWRNGWFHTGDGFRKDTEGYYFFVDRIKDSIRRRGENISSFEVEAEVQAHPDVNEAAAIGVPSEFGEDEVMVFVTPVAGRSVDPEDLITFLLPRVPHFMVPRYVQIIDEFPKTPTQKIQKHILREHVKLDDAWDREAAGIRVKREKVGGI